MSLSCSDTGLKSLSQRVYYLAAIDNPWGKESICRYHDTFCAGTEYQQYSSVQDCMDYLSSLPASDPTTGPNAVLAGNSLACRIKHHFLIPFSLTHCSHIGRGDNYPNGAPEIRPCTSDEYEPGFLAQITSAGTPIDLAVPTSGPINTCLAEQHNSAPFPNLCGIECLLGPCGTE